MLGSALFLLLLASDRPLAVQTLELREPCEVVAVVEAGCAGCDWGRRGYEAAALELQVDGRYSQHLFLTRGEPRSPYPVTLGRLAAGGHRVEVYLDERRCARHARHAEVASLEVEPFAEGSSEARMLAHAPILEARPDTLGRFSDVPLLAWVELDTLAEGGRRLRYSVVFSNEDGGTPPDRLMATWGRLTDIEFVYGVELDASSREVAREYQGRGHRLLPFAGRLEGAHPVLHVATRNNMVSDRGRATLRMRPCPRTVDLALASREAVMDSEPWTYAVSAAEVRREGRVAPSARPGSKKLPDPRLFATLEACAETQDATLAFSVGVLDVSGALRWFDSDAGLRDFRIGRRASEFPNGCFRGAVALPTNTRAERVAALRFRGFTRSPRKGEAALPSGSGHARLTAVNKLFLFGPDDRPGPSLFSWQGALELPADGPPAELPVQPSGAPAEAHQP